MMISLNTKEFIKKLKKSKFTGKYTSGEGNKSDNMSPECVIMRNDDTSVKILNANNYSFVKIIAQCEELDMDEAVTVEIDSLIKYLGMFPMVRLTVKNEKLVGENDIGDKNFELPLLNRHESNDVIYHFLEVFKDAPYNSKDTVLLSDDNKLNNGIRILTDELMMAFKECEAVGSSVYKLKWDGTNVLLSSSNNDESMEHLLEPISVNGDPFEVEFSGPVHTILEDSWNHTVNIHGGEHKPTLFTIGNDALYLIAPRME